MYRRRNEIHNSRRFQVVLAEAGETGRVVVPELHEELCSSKVLVMEWIDGAKITDVEALQRQVCLERVWSEGETSGRVVGGRDWLGNMCAIRGEALKAVQLSDVTS